ncbi:cytochrome P450 [Nemania sp. NC0429]|nr:cytochrome P450 [Nemania sp. NC0429]
MLPGIFVFVAAACMVSAIIATSRKSTTGLQRVGSSPGPFSLRTWWARWNWYKHGHEEVEKRYKQSKDSNYITQTMMGDTIVLAPKFLNELKMLPEAKLSSTAALVDSVMGHVTGVDLLLRDHLSHDICRGPLRRNLPIFLPRMAEELQRSLAQLLEEDLAEGPTTCIAYELLYSLIGRLSSLVFVGETHCRNSTWETALTALPTNVEITKLILMPFPSFLRRYIAPMIPQRNRIFRDRAAVCDVLFRQSEKHVANDELSVMKLFIDSGMDTDPKSITARLLLLTAAALHTSSMAITHAVFDLCVMPQYAEPLRSEAQMALAQDDGQWQLSTIHRLRRLDSFLKESQRTNHSTFLGFDRKVMSPIKLSDGTTILEPGAKIAIPGGPMSLDPTYYSDARDFDGFRFYRPDESDTSSVNTQQDYTGIEPGNLSWGSGRFTCPGRWYASAMIKLVIANLLLAYDISFPGGQTARPPNVKYDTERFPNFDQKIILRKRVN